jgi:uncharacterized GH25 family protein
MKEDAMRILPLLLMLAAPVHAHELWIEPLDWQPKVDGRLEADLVNGQLFEGLTLSYLPKWFSRFDVVAGDAVATVEGRMGDTPALGQAVLGDGLHVVVYQSTPSTVDYKEWAKFLKFVAHKDLGDIEIEHRARGLPEADFKEVYTRYSKALVGVGAGAGADKSEGLETELVALDNPYIGGLQAIRVQVFYQGAARADAQVELFEKAADDTVVVSLHQTDADGIASLPVRSGYVYMADAVVMRVPSDATAAEYGAVWETLWANLTFAVP